jgi:hypothetical protein
MWLFDKDIEKELAAKNLSSYKHSIDDSKDRKRIIRISIILIILYWIHFSAMDTKYTNYRNSDHA